MNAENDDEMLPEYDFSQAERGRYTDRIRRAGVRTLDADLRDAFPDSASVNRVLRVMKEELDEDDGMLAEYDFSKLKRVESPFGDQFRKLNLVSLDEDVKAAFPTSEAVNEALRSLMENGQPSRHEAELQKAS